MSKATLCWWNDQPDAAARLAALVEQAAAAGRIKRRTKKNGEPAASPCPSQFGWQLAVRIFERLVWHANSSKGLLVWPGPDTLAAWVGCDPDTAATVLAWWGKVGLLEDGPKSGSSCFRCASGLASRS